MRPRRGPFEPPRRPEPQARINDAIRVPRVRLIDQSTVTRVEQRAQLGVKPETAVLLADEVDDSQRRLLAVVTEAAPDLLGEHRRGQQPSMRSRALKAYDSWLANPAKSWMDSFGLAFCIRSRSSGTKAVPCSPGRTTGINTSPAGMRCERAGKRTGAATESNRQSGQQPI